MAVKATPVPTVCREAGAADAVPDAPGEVLGLGDGLGEGLGDELVAGPPPKAGVAPAIELADESRAHAVPDALNQMAAEIRGNWVPNACAPSMIHCPLVTPAGSPATGSTLPHSASIMGLVALSDATRE